jgi:hypothetical protein
MDVDDCVLELGDDAKGMIREAGAMRKVAEVGVQLCGRETETAYPVVGHVEVLQKVPYRRGKFTNRTRPDMLQ